MADFDWAECKARLTPQQEQEIAAERGVNPFTIDRLRERNCIGSCYCNRWERWCLAFPISDLNGNIWRAHCRSPKRNGDGKFDWAYEPLKDPQNRPITSAVIGQLATAHTAYIFESQWDAISAIDKLDLIGEIDDGQVVLIATRGAQNAGKIKPITFAGGASVYAFPQNYSAGAKWLDDVIAITDGCYVVEIPAPHKDLGDWIKDPAFLVTSLEWAIDNAPFQKPPSGAQQNHNAKSEKTSQEEQLFAELLAKYQKALCDFAEFRTRAVKPREALIGKWMKEGDTGFVFGQRGSGKTWLLDLLISHLTTGRDVDEDWTIPLKRAVVLVDGEMPWDDTRARLCGLGADDALLRVLHHEVLFDRTGLTMNMTDSKVQRIITSLCEEANAKLLVLDTQSSLFRGMAEADADAWELVTDWLLDLRRRRIATLIVLHAGWNGEHARGTSRREDDAFWVIKVKQLEDQEPDQKGCKFETKFTKWRNLDSAPTTRHWHVVTEADGSVTYNCIELSFDAKVLGLIEAGLRSASEIAEELSVAKSTVSKATARLEKKKLRTPRQRESGHL
jgi:hypothetical protein